MAQKDLIAALKSCIDAQGGKTFSEFAVSDAPLRNVSLVAQAVMATQPILPMPLGQNFEDVDADGVLTPDGGKLDAGQYGVALDNVNKRRKRIYVSVPESMCIPEGGDCDITCDGFGVARTEDEQIMEYDIDNPICSPGFQVTGEAFVKGEGVMTVSEKVRRGLQKELAFMDSAISTYIYDELLNLADVPDYNQIPYFQTSGVTTYIHPDTCSSHDLPIYMMEYFDAHQLENPVAIDTGILYYNRLLAETQSSSTDVYGSNINKWNLFTIVNAFKEFRNRRDKIVAFEPGSVGLAGFIKHPMWHKIPGHEDYYAGPIFSNQLPITYDLYYKRECIGDEDGDPTLSRHTFKLKFYCQLFKRPNGCPTKADILVFEKNCFEVAEPCSDTLTCSDIDIQVKQHDTGALSLLIPGDPLMVTASDGSTTTIDSGTITICDATNNYAEQVATYDYTDAVGADLPVSLPSGNYKVKYEVTITAGEDPNTVTCTKIAEAKVCVLPCEETTDNGSGGTGDGDDKGGESGGGTLPSGDDSRPGTGVEAEIGKKTTRKKK